MRTLTNRALVSASFLAVVSLLDVVGHEDNIVGGGLNVVLDVAEGGTSFLDVPVPDLAG